MEEKSYLFVVRDIGDPRRIASDGVARCYDTADTDAQCEPVGADQHLGPHRAIHPRLKMAQWPKGCFNLDSAILISTP